MIFSASRRTDIPAFYGQWLVNRLRQGEAAVRNPVNPRQVTVFRFDAMSVDCIVFWTKNPAPFLRYLPEIDSLGYKYYFQFTLTAYRNDIERNIDKSGVIDTFMELSSRIGKEKVLWRYDPILINERYSAAFHAESFDFLAEKLRGYTEKCVISFVDPYPFLKDTFAALHIAEPADGEMEAMAQKLCEIAGKYTPALRIAACSEKIDLGKYGVERGKCIDDELIARITGKSLAYRKDPSQRKACGCALSRDLGTYGTCFHDCAYCYAGGGTMSERHTLDPQSPMLRDVIDYRADTVKVIDLRKH
jgi:hypothetical protein